MYTVVIMRASIDLIATLLGLGSKRSSPFCSYQMWFAVTASLVPATISKHKMLEIKTTT